MQQITARGRKMEVGLGWFRFRRCAKKTAPFLAHPGGGAFFNMTRIYPDRQLGIVVMGNASSYDREPLAQAAVAAAV